VIGPMRAADQMNARLSPLARLPKVYVKSVPRENDEAALDVLCLWKQGCLPATIARRLNLKISRILAVIERVRKEDARHASVVWGDDPAEVSAHYARAMGRPMSR
jgi:hypothetical protein